MAENPWRGVGDAWAITSTMLAGMVAWGGAGFLLDRWLNFRGLFLPIGLIVGMAASIYLVYVRYGREDHET